jgi:hypothetical protein
MTGKPLRLLKVIQVIPHGVQPGLTPVKLYSRIEVDPLRDDLAVKLVELRNSIKTKHPQLAGGLKVAANSAAFGVLCQRNVKDLDSPSPLHVFSGETDYLTLPDEVWEEPGDFFSPVIAALVTGGSHLRRLTQLQIGSAGRNGNGKRICHHGFLRLGISSYPKNWAFHISRHPG